MITPVLVMPMTFVSALCIGEDKAINRRKSEARIVLSPILLSCMLLSPLIIWGREKNTCSGLSSGSVHAFHLWLILVAEHDDTIIPGIEDIDISEFINCKPRWLLKHIL
jgi:hypothetical protein